MHLLSVVCFQLFDVYNSNDHFDGLHEVLDRPFELYAEHLGYCVAAVVHFDVCCFCCNEGYDCFVQLVVLGSILHSPSNLLICYLVVFYLCHLLPDVGLSTVQLERYDVLHIFVRNRHVVQHLDQEARRLCNGRVYICCTEVHHFVPVSRCYWPSTVKHELVGSFHHFGR